MTLPEAAQALRERRISVRELTLDRLDRIERLNPRINALITITRESALRRADFLDAELARDADHIQERRPLFGIPIVRHKDCVFTAGVHAPPTGRVSSRNSSRTAIRRRSRVWIKPAR